MKGISTTLAPRLRRPADKLLAWWRARPTRIRVPARGWTSLGVRMKRFSVLRSQFSVNALAQRRGMPRLFVPRQAPLPDTCSKVVAARRNRLRKPLRVSHLRLGGAAFRLLHCPAARDRHLRGFPAELSFRPDVQPAHPGECGRFELRRKHRLEPGNRLPVC